MVEGPCSLHLNKHAWWFPFIEKTRAHNSTAAHPLCGVTHLEPLSGCCENRAEPAWTRVFAGKNWGPCPFQGSHSVHSGPELSGGHPVDCSPALPAGGWQDCRARTASLRLLFLGATHGRYSPSQGVQGDKEQHYKALPFLWVNRAWYWVMRHRLPQKLVLKTNCKPDFSQKQGICFGTCKEFSPDFTREVCLWDY